MLEKNAVKSDSRMKKLLSADSMILPSNKYADGCFQKSTPIFPLNIGCGLSSITFKILENCWCLDFPF